MRKKTHLWTPDQWSPTPWTATKFCACLSLITLVGDLVGRFTTGTSGVGMIAFYGYMPMCFYMMSLYLCDLKKENQELRSQISELAQVKQTVAQG